MQERIEFGTHNRAKSLQPSAIIERENELAHKVSSERNPDIYYNVKRIMKFCYCNLKCSYCNACSHLYSCTCIDSCTNNTVCKHIHLIQMKTLDMKEYNQSSITTPATQATPVNSSDLEYFQKVTSFSFPTGKISDTDKTALMDNIKSRLSNIALICDQVDSADLLENVYTALGGVLNSIKLPATKKRIASNNNMETQRKYFTTKKKENWKLHHLKNHQLMKLVCVSNS